MLQQTIMPPPARPGVDSERFKALATDDAARLKAAGDFLKIQNDARDDDLLTRCKKLNAFLAQVCVRVGYPDLLARHFVKSCILLQLPSGLCWQREEQGGPKEGALTDYGPPWAEAEAPSVPQQTRSNFGGQWLRTKACSTTERHRC